MKIALDFDGVLCDTKSVWIKLFHEVHPERPIPRDVDFTQYNLTKVFQCSREELEVLFNKVRYGKQMKYASPCDSNFYIWLNRLITEGHELFILSANPEGTEKAIHYWLGKYGMENIPIKLVGMPLDKFKHEWDIIIDDAHHIAEEMNDYHNRYHLIYQQPWNENVPEKSNVFRVFNMQDAYNMIHEINDLRVRYAEA